MMVRHESVLVAQWRVRSLYGCVGSQVLVISALQISSNFCLVTVN